MHVHIGALEALHTFLAVIIVGFFWRWLSARWAANDGVTGTIGRAMAVIY